MPALLQYPHNHNSFPPKKKKREVKPENILLYADNRLCSAISAIAAILVPEQLSTQDQQGTPRYNRAKTIARQNHALHDQYAPLHHAYELALPESSVLGHYY